MLDGSTNTRLSADNTAILLVDHQVGLITGVRDIEASELKHNVVALASAAKVLDVPTIVTSAAPLDVWGPTIPELLEVVGGEIIDDRALVNAWDDPRVQEAVKATGATKLVISGVSLEVCAAFPALAALASGYQTYVAVDASGTFNRTKRETGLLRLQAAGVVLTDYATPIIEILHDNSRPIAPEVYGALDMPFANLLWQLSAARSAAA